MCRQEWYQWLRHTLTSADISPSEREAALTDWKSAPSAVFCHPREEHLLPLFVAAGAAGLLPGRVIWNEPMSGFPASSFPWD
jgi:aromatic ring-opening dioxygenase catalytic subunit (LigB family)